MNNQYSKHLPKHQHQSTTQKQSKDQWNDLVTATELQVDFHNEFRKWADDKSNSANVIAVGKTLMELQQRTGKSGGRLSYYQVYHRVEEAKAAISKGLHKPVEKKVSHTSKNIVKKANGDTVWVLK